MDGLTDIQKHFTGLLEANTATTVLENVMKKPIPKLFDSVSFMAYPSLLGTKLAELIREMNAACWNRDIQSRRLFAIVQSYGSGKTKMGLMLSQNYIVLPWRTLTTDHLVMWLKEKQEHLLRDLCDNPTYQMVEQFSNQCLVAFASIFFAYHELFKACVQEKHIAEDEFIHRFYFALMLLNAPDCVTKWIQDWAEKFFCQNKCCDIPTLFSKINSKDLRVVFLLDEVHELIDICRGYCLHRINEDKEEDGVKHWRYEQTDKQPSPNKSHCTDLFYQLRWIMLISISIKENCFAFVMCSTEYRTWEQFEVRNSPFSRGLIKRFFNLHYFTEEDIRQILMDFFKIDGVIDSLEINERHQYLSRPLFFAEFIQELFLSSNSVVLSADSIQNWFNKAFESSKENNYQRAKSQLQGLNYSAGNHTSQGVIKLLYAAQRLCNGTLQIMNATELSTIIAHGVACIHYTAERFRIADRIFIDVLLHQFCDDDVILPLLADTQCIWSGLVSQDHSAKGFLAERTLTWMILKHGIPFSVNANCQAGTTLELEPDIGEEADLLIRIAKGQRCAIVLPSTAAGPDLWYRSSEGMVIAIQSKCTTSHMTLAEFNNALKSLNPVLMYRTSTSLTRESWKTYLTELSTQIYIRCIFSATGFSTDVHYLVSEYNQKFPRGIIFLYDLTTLSPHIINSLYQKLSNGGSIKEKPRNCPAILQQDWLKKTQSAKQKLKKAILQSYCTERRIPFSNDTKDDFLKKLDSYNIDGALEKLRPKFE